MSIAEIISMLPSMTEKEKMTLKKALENELKDNSKPTEKKKSYRKAGWAKGSLEFMSDTFDESLNDMTEYM